MSLVLLQAQCKAAVNKLVNLSNTELDEIINSEEKFESILSDVDQSYLQEIINEKESILASNNAAAEENLSKEPELVEGREKVQQLAEEGESLSNSVQQKNRELKEKLGDMSIETALALLQTAASEMEEESDNTAKQFLDSEMNLEDYLNQFLEKRKLMHLRLVKAEKLAKILSRSSYLGNGPGNYVNAPPVNINTRYFPGVPISSDPQSVSAVPYPTGPLNMPMPENYFQNHY